MTFATQSKFFFPPTRFVHCIGLLFSYAVLDEFLETMDLKGFVEAKLTTLSGGQRRKVSLIAALLNRPKLLVLDEPSTGPSLFHVWEFILSKFFSFKESI